MNKFIQCPNYKHYKGIHPPKCNNGTPCKSCLEKFQKKCLAELQKIGSPRLTLMMNQRKELERLRCMEKQIKTITEELKALTK